MAGENIMFFENDESYTMLDLYLDNLDISRFFGYKDSYNY